MCQIPPSFDRTAAEPGHCSMQARPCVSWFLAVPEKVIIFSDCSKMPRCKAPEILRVGSRRIRSDILPRRRVGESARGVPWRYAAMTKDEGSKADGRFQQPANSSGIPAGREHIHLHPRVCCSAPACSSEFLSCTAPHAIRT